MLSRRNLIVAWFLSIGLAVLASPAFAQPTPIPVVASFSILGDFVRNVGGDRIALTILVGPDGDAHVYSPTPADGKMLSQASLIVANGLKFESWLDRLVKSTGAKAPVIAATKGIVPLDATSTGDNHGHFHPGQPDPHAWQSIPNARIYVANIRDALSAVDPAGKPVYEANAAAYLAKLDALEAETKAAIAKIPAARRRIITSHDAFGYFAKAYTLQFIAPRGVSTDAEASAKDVARLIRQIRDQKIPAVFLENVTDRRLIDQIARETGAIIGGTLVSDALTGPSGVAPTYLDMMRHNVGQLTKALASANS